MIFCQSHLFDIPEGVVYLNCAYMSPLMRSALEAGRSGLDRKTRPWQIHAEDFFDREEDLRRLAAMLFRCSADDVAIIPSASYGISIAALNLPINRGQSILLLDEQFPSNYYPWQRLAQEKHVNLKVVRWPQDGDWTPGVLDALNDGVAIAALPHTQWTSGGLLDLLQIGEACRRHGTALVLDLTQSLGAYPFDAQAVQPDFAVSATYKWLLGPYSYGVMYVNPKWQQGRPLEENWVQRDKARDFSGLIHYTDRYQAGARRFDMGERSNFTLLPATIAAMEQLVAWGVEEISASIGALTSRLISAAEEFGWSTPPQPVCAPHYICLRSAEPPSESLIQQLMKQRIYVSIRGSSIRVTPHVYNLEEHIDRLLEILKQNAPRTRKRVSLIEKRLT